MVFNEMKVSEVLSPRQLVASALYVLVLLSCEVSLALRSVAART